MNPLATGADTRPADPTPRDWDDALLRGARESLDQLDPSTTLAEAKAALARLLCERRREWEARRWG
jgi:hypothetical protein